MENEKIDEIRSFLESSKNDDELKISESQLRETIDFVINSIGEHLDFYKLMFNLGKESIYMKIIRTINWALESCS